MRHDFASKNEFLDFQDLYYCYLLKQWLCLDSLLSCSHDFRKEAASYAISHAHLDLLFEGFSPLKPTQLTQKEHQLCQEAFVTMNIAVLRYRKESRKPIYSSYANEKIGEVSFPCEFSEEGPSFIELPEEQERLLDAMEHFYEVLFHFDSGEIAAWYARHYEGIDETILARRIAFLKDHFVAEQAERCFAAITQNRR